jgi:hypothetical protein
MVSSYISSEELPGKLNQPTKKKLVFHLSTLQLDLKTSFQVIEPSRAALGWYLMLPKRKDKSCEARDSTIFWILTILVKEQFYTNIE